MGSIMKNFNEWLDIRECESFLRISPTSAAILVEAGIWDKVKKYGRNAMYGGVMAASAMNMPMNFNDPKANDNLIKATLNLSDAEIQTIKQQGMYDSILNAAKSSKQMARSGQQADQSVNQANNALNKAEPLVNQAFDRHWGISPEERASKDIDHINNLTSTPQDTIQKINNTIGR